MISPHRWRDRQISSFTDFSSTATILEQEQIMLDFMSRCGGVSWRWAGTNSRFKTICSDQYTISNSNYKGIVIFGAIISNLSTGELIKTIGNLIQTVDYAYVAVNRYYLTQHDLPFALPDLIADSLDIIMSHCHPKFQRLHTFPSVDGNHMVGSHPMDCYGLCK